MPIESISGKTAGDETVYRTIRYIATQLGAALAWIPADSAVNPSADAGFPSGQVFGLLPQWVNGSTLSFTAGGCKDDANAVDIPFATPATVTITPTPDQTWHVFAYLPSGTTTGALHADAALNGASLPANDGNRRIFSIPTFFTGELPLFFARGGWIYWDEPLLDVDAQMAATQQPYRLAAPIGASTVVDVLGFITSGASTARLYRAGEGAGLLADYERSVDLSGIPELNSSSPTTSRLTTNTDASVVVSAAQMSHVKLTTLGYAYRG